MSYVNLLMRWSVKTALGLMMKIICIEKWHNKTINNTQEQYMCIWCEVFFVWWTCSNTRTTVAYIRQCFQPNHADYDCLKFRVVFLINICRYCFCGLIMNIQCISSDIYIRLSKKLVLFSHNYRREWWYDDDFDNSQTTLSHFKPIHCNHKTVFNFPLSDGTAAIFSWSTLLCI